MSNGVINGTADEAVELWRHPNPEQTELWTFQQYAIKKHELKGETYQDLWQWSVDHPAAFWQEVWEYTGLKASKPPTSVGQSTIVMRFS